MIIDIRSGVKGPFRVVSMLPNGTEVELFKCCFYETAVQQAFARTGHVRFNNLPLVNPYRKDKNEVDS